MGHMTGEPAVATGKTRARIRIVLPAPDSVVVAVRVRVSIGEFPEVFENVRLRSASVHERGCGLAVNVAADARVRLVRGETGALLPVLPKVVQRIQGSCDCVRHSAPYPRCSAPRGPPSPACLDAASSDQGISWLGHEDILAEVSGQLKVGTIMGGTRLAMAARSQPSGGSTGSMPTQLRVRDLARSDSLIGYPETQTAPAIGARNAASGNYPQYRR